jgi:pentatricopeptide repeat protein
LDISKGKSMIRELIRSPAPLNIDIRAVGVFLKVAFLCNDLEIGQLIWSWSWTSREMTQKENLIPITIQFLLLCGKGGKLDLLQQVWNESISFGVTNDHTVIGAMFTALAFFGGNETEELLSTISLESLTERMLVSILTSYSHQGRPQKAWNLLQQIKIINNQIVGLPAYTCVVDGYARAGEFRAAIDVVEYARKDGIKPNVITWKSILSPCRYYAEFSSALIAFNEIKSLCESELDQQHLASAYVLMADVYKACGDFSAAEKLHRERLMKGLTKERGEVKVTVHGTTYYFHVGEIPSYEKEIEAKLLEWKIFLASQCVSTESIECKHSEKLALAFAVIMGLKDISLENYLRICLACHAASILITQYEGITIRHWDNSKRVHIMKDGFCSCGGRY